MTTPAIRAALERLVELDGHLNETSYGWMQAWSDAIAAARAALAQPEGEGLSLADIGDLCEEHSFNCHDGESIEILHDMITAALSRWGRPTAPPAPAVVPVAVSERLPVVPAGGLVERVATAMQPGTFDWSAYESEARAAIREVAAAAVQWLEQEANR